MGNLDDLSDYSKTPSPHSGVTKTVEADLLTSPLPYFERAVRDLIPHLPDDQQRRLRKRIRVRMRPDLRANAEAYPRRLRCLGYEVAVNQGWTRFLIDAVWLFLARTKVVAPDGATSVSCDVSHDEAESILRDAVGSYVTKDPQWTTSPKLLHARTRRIALEATLPTTRHRDWALWVLRMIRFTTAHELGHIRHDHFYAQTANQEQEWGQEYEADQIAAELLVASVRASYPVSGGGTLARIADRIISLEQFDLVTALGGVAILFTLQDILQQAARSLHESQRLPHHWERCHPPARKRYRAFRHHCITACGVRPELFSQVTVALPAPDQIQESLYLLALDISWLDEPTPDDVPQEQLGPWALQVIDTLAAQPGAFSVVTRRRLDLIRRCLEKSWNMNETVEPEVLQALVRSSLVLSFVCRTQLDLPEDSLLYCDMAQFYLGHYEQHGANSETYRVQLTAESAAVRKQLGRLASWQDFGGV